MNKLFFALLMFLASAQVFAQDVYICKDINIHFFSEAPLENIEATTEKAVGAINAEDGKVFFKVPIKTFDFEKELMEEHFNENYMESDEFPHGIYNGFVTGEWDASTPGTYEVSVEGTMNIHGVEQERKDMGTITVNEDGSLDINAVFMVALEDHEIEVPKLVVKNIAENIEITVKGNFLPKE